MLSHGIFRASKHKSHCKHNIAVAPASSAMRSTSGGERGQEPTMMPSAISFQLRVHRHLVRVRSVRAGDRRGQTVCVHHPRVAIGSGDREQLKCSFACNAVLQWYASTSCYVHQHRGVTAINNSGCCARREWTRPELSYPPKLLSSSPTEAASSCLLFQSASSCSLISAATPFVACAVAATTRALYAHS